MEKTSSEEDKCKIEEATRDQYLCDKWFAERKTRLTSSRHHFSYSFLTGKMSTYTEVKDQEVFISGMASDVAWEALRMLGTVQDILTPAHLNRCYQQVRIWKERSHVIEVRKIGYFNGDNFIE